MTDTCDKCQKELALGEWPWCPHGFGTYRNIPDDIPGGLVIHNLGPTPVKVYSHSERRALAERRGLVERVHHVDGDKHVGRMV